LRTAPGLLVAGQSASSAIAPAAQPKTRRLVQPGGFFPRLIALIIDGLILSVVIVPVLYLVLGQTPTHVTPTAESNGFLEQLSGSGGSSDQTLVRVQLFLGIAILLLFYYVGTWSILGGSPGQLVMSLRVVDASAKTIGFGHAVIRYIMKVVFSLLAPVSAVMVALGKDKRAIHDLLAGTYVIQYLDPKLEDFDSVLPATQAQAAPAPPPVVSQVPQAAYAGATPVAAAAGEPAAPRYQPPSSAPLPPSAPLPSSAPLPPNAPLPPGAPMPPPVPAVSPPATPAPPGSPGADESAFEHYAAPAAPDLPVFQTAEPGGYQPMAPPPSAPPPPWQPPPPPAPPDPPDPHEPPARPAPPEPPEPPAES
jgi:uncharacterized RDD family membrane protein YckC